MSDEREGASRLDFEADALEHPFGRGVPRVPASDVAQIVGEPDVLKLDGDAV